MQIEISPALLFLAQAAIIIALPYLIWSWKPVRAAVPLVVVQIMAGILLGPSILGGFSPEIFAALFPRSSLDNINGLAWISVVFFAFLTGLHFDLTEVRDTSAAFVATSLSSVLVPTVLGGVAGWWVWEHFPDAAGGSANGVTFTIGFGVAAGVTALPVLGAILREMHLTRDPIGAMALGCAAVNDAVLWVLVAGLLAMTSGGDPLHALVILTAALVYLIAMVALVRPALTWVFRHAILHKRVSEKEVVILSGMLLLSTLITEAIGIHYVIGAFAFGAIMPKEVAKDVLLKFESVVTVILLPFFFISTGLKTKFDIGSSSVLVIFLLMTAVSMAGKMAGTIVPARLVAGMSWRDSTALGAFIQCKGLMEIVVLTMLLDAGIISPMAFSGMILMAVAATAATKPLVLLIHTNPRTRTARGLR